MPIIMTDNFIYDLLVILAAGLVAGLICKRLRVPSLIGYMLIGVLIGPGGLGWVREKTHDIGQMTEVGVFLLLFAIGLEFSLDELVRLGRRLIVGGTIQMTLVAAPIMGLLMAVGLPWRASWLLATAAAFSSTVLVFKTLAEWGRTSSPAGRRAIGIVLFQDITLVPLLLVIPMLAGGQAPGLSDYFVLMMTSAAFVSCVVLTRWLLNRWLIPHLASQRSPELMVLAAVVVLGSVTLIAHEIGLPPAVGSFAAGLMLSGNRWTNQFDAVLMPFRETFAVFFFVGLGLLLNPSTFVTHPLVMLTGIALLIVIKAVAAATALRMTGLSWTPAAATGVGLAHVGEFAFVLVALAFREGLIDDQTAQQSVAIALTSLLASPLLLQYGMRQTEHYVIDGETSGLSSRNAAEIPCYSIVIGAGPIGRSISSHLETTGQEVCVVDMSPLNLHLFAQQGFHTVAGDATDPETLSRAHAERMSLAVVCVPEDASSVEIVRLIRRGNAHCSIIVRCRYNSNITALKKAGATHVVSEETLTGEVLIGLLAKYGM